MALLTTAFVWVLQSTAAGLVALALPRLFRFTSPRWLVAWWSGVALGVVVLPLFVTLAPTPAFEPRPVAVAVDATTATPAMPTPGVVLPVARTLLILWAAGTLARLTWLWVGARRLRRLVSAGVHVEDAALDEARRVADVYLPIDVLEVDGVAPCAVGWAPARIVVPRSLRAQPYEQRRSVYVHELLHVVRGDVRITWVEELWRALWWWQPAVWWTLAQLRLAREQAVDVEVCEVTGAMRDYVDALVWCSSLPATTAATLHAGSRRHVLVRRVALMCKEQTMTRVRGTVVTAAMLTVLGTVTAALAYVAPLDVEAVLGAQDEPSRVGALERTAVQPSLDMPAPRRVRSVAPVWMPSQGTAFSMRVHVVVDAAGRVAEARIARVVGASAAGAANQPIAPDDARAAVLDAVRQWEFEAPLQAPMLITTDVLLGDGALLLPSKVAAPARGGRVLRAGGAITPPARVYQVPAVYPQVALDARVQGVVIVECTVGPDGSVIDTNVVRSIPLLDEAAVDAVRQWRYTPTLLNGEPVSVIITVTVNFSLK